MLAAQAGLRAVCVIMALTSAMSASVRLHNEVVGPSWTSLVQHGVVLANSTSHTTTPYTDFNCSAPLLVTTAREQSLVMAAPGCDSEWWSVLAVAGGPAHAPLSASALPDRMAVLGTDYIDVARLRVVNGFTALPALTVRAWTSECYHCLLPELATLPSGVGMLDYSPIATQHDYIVQVDPDTTSMSTAECGDRAERWTLASESARAGAVPDRCTGGCSTVWATDNGTETALVVGRFPFKEHGVYDVVVQNTAPPTLRLVTNASGNNVYTPLWVAALSALGLAVLYHTGKAVHARITSSAERDDLLGVESVHVAGGAASSGRPDSKVRVKSIDVFRGAALCIMVFVNYGGTAGTDDMRGSGGGNYWFFDHSAWFGLTVADLVFPWFLWTMGVAMSLSLAGQRRRGVSKAVMTQRLLLRAAKLAALGIAIIDNASDLSNARIPGVLQYFAVATVTVGLSEVWLPTCQWGNSSSAAPATQKPQEALAASSLNRTAHAPGFASSVGGVAPPSQQQPLLGAAAPPSRRRDGEPTCLMGCAGDIVPHAAQAVFFLALLSLYLCLQFFLPVPGCPTGYTGPGGIGDFARHPHCTGGAHRYIDLQVWGLRHMFHSTTPDNTPVSGATCANIYKCDVYDPEGTLGAITASFMAYLGLLAGRMMVNAKPLIAARRAAGAAAGDDGERLAYHAPLLLKWVSWGVVLCSIGAGLSGAAQNTGVLPLSKNLWSPSFVVTLGGMAFLAVAALYVTMDVWHGWSGSPFVYVGSNSILVYVGSEVLQYYFPFTITPYPPVGGDGGALFRTHTMALVSNMVGVGTWMVIAFVLYRNKVFFKL